MAHLRPHGDHVDPRDGDHPRPGFPIALYIARVAQGRLKAMLLLLCLLPFWVSELVRTLGWMILLRETGVVSYVLRATGLADQPVELLYNDGAVILGLVYGGLLFMIVPLANALESLEPSVVEAGFDLGEPLDGVAPHRHSPCHAGIVAGSIIVFMLTVGNFATPVLLGGKNGLWFTEQIYAQFIGLTGRKGPPSACFSCCSPPPSYGRDCACRDRVCTTLRQA